MSQKVRKTLYEEAEGSYTDILYTHILCDKVFPHNDGIIKEAQIGKGKGFVRVDLLTRYKSPERYFAIEVKYWPGAFEGGLKQAAKLRDKVHAVFLGIPAEDVPVAQDQQVKFPDIGILPISRIFPTHTAAIKASVNTNPSLEVIKGLSKYFDDIYIYPLLKKYYQGLWKEAERPLSKRRRKLAFLTLYLAATKIYSYAKYLSHKKVFEFANDLADIFGWKVVHPDWACWDLYLLGVAEQVRVGVRKNWYYKLNPRLILSAKEAIDKCLKDELDKVDGWVRKTNDKIINQRANSVRDYTK